MAQTTNNPMASILARAKELAATTQPGGGRKTPKACACGCKGMTRGGNWLPGHDAKALSLALAAERARIATANAGKA